MYEREQGQNNRKLREKRMRERRKRRRRKKLIRMLLLLLLLLLIVFAIIGIFFLGKSLFADTAKESWTIPWNFGSVDIVLDAGHGGKDQGSSYDEVIEKDITLEIAKKIEALLKESDYKVALVRDDDTFVELGERAEFANRKSAKIFVSIHCNSSEDGEGEGIETFYTDQKDELNEQLAQILQKKIIEQTDARDREAKTADYTVLVRTNMPAALVEVGFLTSSSERALLQTEDYQDKLAKGIAEGILEFLEIYSKRESATD